MVQRAVCRHGLAQNMGFVEYIVRPYMSEFWAGRGLVRGRRVQCSALWSWFDEIVLISNNMSIQSRAKVDKIHPQESKYF